MRKVGAKSLAELRDAPPEAILAAAPGLGFRPIVDGRFLPRAPAEIFAAGEQTDAPLLAGWNKDEGFNFTLLGGDNADRPYAELVRGIFEPRRGGAAVLSRRLGATRRAPRARWAAISPSSTRPGPGSRRRNARRADIFRFRFDRAPLSPQGWFGQRDSREAGAFHAGEIPYVFDTLDAFPWLIREADRALATLTSGYWLNFVKTGDPNGPGLPRWPSYRSSGAQVMPIDAPPKQDRKRGARGRFS